MDMSILYSVASLSGMGLLFGLGLGYAGIKFKVEEDPKLPLIREALPGANCGGCGFPGCDGLADAILKSLAKPNACPVGGADTVIKISEVLGIKAEIKEKQVSFIKCRGNCNKSNFRYDYYGLLDCNAATQLAGGGSKSCSYGCLGGGSCVTACKFGAIDIVEGIAVVNRERCTACGMCVEACPKKLIELIPYKSGVKVNCNSNDNGKVVRGNCTVGCIGCKMCEKACEFDAVHVTDMLAKIDYNKCTECNACVKKCPMNTITSASYSKSDESKKADNDKTKQAVNTEDVKKEGVTAKVETKDS